MERKGDNTCWIGISSRIKVDITSVSNVDTVAYFWYIGILPYWKNYDPNPNWQTPKKNNDKSAEGQKNNGILKCCHRPEETKVAVSEC